MVKKEYVIIGNGAAGISAIEAIRCVDQKVGITVISEEPYLAYSKVLLHNYISNEIDEKGLFIRTEKFYEDHRIDILFRTKVKKVVPEEQAIHLADKSKIGFEKLLIATGSLPWKPPIKGIDQIDANTMWTLNDARKIRSSLRDSRNAIVIGSSFVGMQALDALIKHGLEVTVVDIADRIMPHSLDLYSSRMLQEYLGDHGVKFLLGVHPIEIQNFKKNKKILILGDGGIVSGDIIIIATGARPNISLVEDSLIEKDVGILVDPFMRTNYHNIFAAGDIAHGFDYLTGNRKIFGLWTTAVEQGKIAGLNMAGRNVSYPGGMDMNTTHILGLPIITIGSSTNKTDSDGLIEEVFTDSKKKIYRKFLFSKEQLIGAILIGYLENPGVINHLIRVQRKLNSEKCNFRSGSLRYRPIYTKEILDYFVSKVEI